ncbi:MAG: endonuclease III [Nitrososphaeraceae archaeon]
MNKKIKKATKCEIEAIKTLFLERYPNGVTELDYKNIYELLIAVMLSAQCTDKRVNLITPKLFDAYPTAFELASSNVDDIKLLINSCSFFNVKAENLIKMAHSLVENFGGEVPLNQKDLMSLAGVGQKTANVVLSEYLGVNCIAVDTHVFRVAHRLGLSDAKTALKTEDELTKKFKTKLHLLHQAMVIFGRYHCKAVNPLCDGCFLAHLCKSNGRFKV